MTNFVKTLSKFIAEPLACGSWSPSHLDNVMTSSSVRTNYGVSTFKFSATKVWESVPPELKRFPYLLFKKRYKKISY